MNLSYLIDSFFRHYIICIRFIRPQCSWSGGFSDSNFGSEIWYPVKGSLEDGRNE